MKVFLWAVIIWECLESGIYLLILANEKYPRTVVRSRVVDARSIVASMAIAVWALVLLLRHAW